MPTAYRSSRSPLLACLLACRGRFYPGTGSVDEVGLGAGEGFTVNVPWAGKDMGNGDYIAAFHQVIIPIAYEFNPDLIIVSAGEACTVAQGPWYREACISQQLLSRMNTTHSSHETVSFVVVVIIIIGTVPSIQRSEGCSALLTMCVRTQIRLSQRCFVIS